MPLFPFPFPPSFLSCLTLQLHAYNKKEGKSEAMFVGKHLKSGWCKVESIIHSILDLLKTDWLTIQTPYERTLIYHYLCTLDWMSHWNGGAYQRVQSGKKVLLVCSNPFRIIPMLVPSFAAVSGMCLKEGGGQRAKMNGANSVRSAVRPRPPWNFLRSLFSPKRWNLSLSLPSPILKVNWGWTLGNWGRDIKCGQTSTEGCWKFAKQQPGKTRLDKQEQE